MKEIPNKCMLSGHRGHKLDPFIFLTPKESPLYKLIASGILKAVPKMKWVEDDLVPWKPNV